MCPKGGMRFCSSLLVRTGSSGPKMTFSKFHNPAGRRRAGFTLVEMLIVIGIIIVLIGVLLPMVTGIYGKASRQRIAGDLQAVAMALEAYKHEHGDYPRIG